MSRCTSSFRRVLLQELMAVKTRSKALLTLYLGHGKSPCFLQVAFLWLVGPDYTVLILPCVDGTKSTGCAF